MAMCIEEGVHVRSALIGQRPNGTGGALVVPLLSWHHQSFDTEPDITCWGGIPVVQDCMVDFMRCEWPQPLCDLDETVAEAVDNMNEDVNAVLAQMQQDTALITFSHFVPRIELTPEKRFIFYPDQPHAHFH